MSERVWDRYLSDQDRARAAIQPAVRKGAGTRPVVVLVDLYRWVFGDRPEPLLEAIKSWPGSCGLAGWDSLPHIQRLLVEARGMGIPVVHLTGLEGMPGWRDFNPRGGGSSDPVAAENRRRRYEIVDEVAPVDGEVVLRKTAPSAFWGTPLAGHLTALNADTVIIAGESTSGCVRASVVDAKSMRYKVIVPEECVFDRDEASHAINLFDMEEKYADVIPLDETIEYLRSVAAPRPVAAGT
ncbi:MAG TPA: isochorismatase family protein [Candidatus Limnocylindrales bacterium]|nr:isochorismatase family protein [Candidatus Limnocylindrales bacterium]